ncbi:ATP-binding protein [Candidatus Poribacteria bacterium]|nr:ATP-binding protein [Candidatus Poribacteria bacterium]
MEQGTIDPSGLGYAYETLAALIAKNLESVEQLMESRDEFVRSASKTREPLKTKIALRTKVWNVPFPRNPFLTGREEVIKQLRNALLSDRVVVLSGFGGIGKTQTAVEYAYRHRDEYQAVLWANADSHDERVSAFVAIANLLNLPENSTPDVVVGVKRWLDNNTGWLLIVDNADTPQSVKDSLPRNPRGHLLLTSRVWGFNNLGIAKPIVLEAMQPDEAKAFLLKRTGRHDAPLQFEEGVAVEQLAWELDYFPLALEIAGAYITKIKSTFRDYLLSYHKRGLSLLEKSGPVSNYSNSVTTIWTQNFEQVKQISEAAADLLRVSAFLNPEDIPLELITLGAVELGPALSVALANVDEDPLALDEVLEPLTQYSLIRRDYESRTYDIPHLVQAVLKAGMDEATQREWAERTVRAVRRAFTPDTIPDESLRDHYDRFLPHIQSCAGLIKKVNVILVLDVAQMLSQTGDYFREIARFDVAKSLLHQAAAIYEKRVLPNDPRLAGVRSSLGELYWELGRYAEAEPFYQDALENQQFLDPDHPDMATDLENYASLLREMGRNAEAEGMEIRAKDIRAKHAQANP